MALVRNFQAATNLPNQIGLNWLAPVGFNNTSQEIIVSKTNRYFPMELYNAAYPKSISDSTSIEIYRGSTIVGLNPATISVSGNVLTDTSASFPTNPPLNKRVLRDANSQTFTIISNTTTTITLSGNPANGIYAILPDFPSSIRAQENYTPDPRTSVGPGYIQNLVVFLNNIFQLKNFADDELVNLIFVDGGGNKFIVKSNTANQVNFFENAVTPVIGPSMTMLISHNGTQPEPYIDDMSNVTEATARVGTGLESDTFYYYTGFVNTIGANVAQAQYALYSSALSTQSYALSVNNTDFGNVLYNLWPTLARELDSTEDLQDLMQIFGFQFNEIHSSIKTYNLQDSDKVLVNALLPLSEQTGLPSVGYAIGADTLRRIARNLIKAWELKGSKEGIALFIRIITTWDVTNGTGDFSGSISDFLPNVSALRLFDPTLGNLNTRIIQPNTVPGARFAKSLPGVVIPGFFTFREFVITLNNVALFVGTSSNITVQNNTTTMTDNTASYGATNSLVGNFLLPNTDEVNDIFQIIGNTSNTITVSGIVNNRSSGGNYAVLSPLNTNRFTILNKLLPVYIPFGTQAGFLFTVS